MEAFVMSRRFLSLLAILPLMIIAITGAAQRPRAINQDSSETTTTSSPSPAPSTVKAKYEGGVFGYNKKMDGDLSFDDANQRLLFRNDKQKEVLFVPYKAITGAYADTHAVQPAAATVASHVPLYGIPASFIKTKVRYLTLQYSDPDSNVAGVTSFRLENKDVLDSVLAALADKSNLTRRGEVFIKKKE
jgi:hypothetical protein